MSAKIILGLNNRIDAADLSADVSFETTLPLSNVQTPILAQTARTVATDSVTMTADFAGLHARSIGVIALAGHNLSRTATVQIITYQDAAVVDDSGVLSPWPYLASDDPHWDAQPFAYAVVDSTRIAELTPTLIYFLPANVAANKVVIVIDDASNADGYIELGRIFIGDALKPTTNVEWNDASYSQVDYSEIQTTKRRIKYAYQYPVIRTATATFKHLTQGEALGGLYAAQRKGGLMGDVLWAPDRPEYHTIGAVNVVDSHWFARAFLANFKALDALTYPYLDANQMLISVEEVAS